MTKKAIKALSWFAEHEPVGWFDASAPSDQMRRYLEKERLIERVSETRMMVLVKYRLTDAGRKALSSNK